MERRLKARSISVIVYDEVMPLQYRALDFIHFTQQGHAIIAAALLPQVFGPLPDSLAMKHRLWTVADLATLVEAAEPKPDKRGPYKKTAA
jgi:hypothetical protein